MAIVVWFLMVLLGWAGGGRVDVGHVEWVPQLHSGARMISDWDFGGLICPTDSDSTGTKDPDRRGPKPRDKQPPTEYSSWGEIKALYRDQDRDQKGNLR